MASSALIGILITFLVVVLILYLVQRLPVDARMRQIIQIIVIIIGIISLLKYLAVSRRLYFSGGRGAVAARRRFGFDHRPRNAT